jgi:Meiotically up-regulated gene 113
MSDAPRGFVYFLERPSTGSIKIGFSATPERRFRELQTGNDEPLTLLCYLPADQSVEAKFHKMLAPDRLVGEWFAPSGKLRALLFLVMRQLREEVAEEQHRVTLLHSTLITKFGDIEEKILSRLDADNTKAQAA